MNIYDVSHYLQILSEKVAETSSRKGYKAAIARAARCQPSFVSNVLAGRANLNDEQAASLAEFWKFSEQETDYFIALVHLERAGTERLKKKYRREIERLRAEHQNYKMLHSFGCFSEVGLTESGLRFYFSNWHVCAIHYATLLPDRDTVESIAQHFCLEAKLVKHNLDQLCELELVANKDGVYTFLHAPAVEKWDPVTGRVVHASMRARANQKYEIRGSRDYFQTMWITVSEKEFNDTRQEINRFMQNLSEKISAPSTSDRLVGLCLDFFEI